MSAPVSITASVVWHPCPACGHMAQFELTGKGQRFYAGGVDATWCCTNPACDWQGTRPQAERAEHRNWATRAPDGASNRRT